MTAFMRALSILVVSGCALVACGSGSDGTAAESSSPSVVEAIGPVALSMTIANVSYYGACGNETFDLDGATWYPVIDTIGEGASFDDSQYEVAPIDREPSGLVAVADPEEGDDVGTLYVYENGIGRFVSESGKIDHWMTTVERTYNWVC